MESDLSSPPILVEVGIRMGCVELCIPFPSWDHDGLLNTKTEIDSLSNECPRI